MGFFDIPDKVGKSSLERGPVETTVQAKWAMGLLNALELCTTSDKGQQLFKRYIHVKKYLTDRWQVEATDGNIALRVMLEQEHIDAMSSATGTPWDIDDEGMWLKGTGWDAADVPYPNMDRWLAAQYPHGPACREMRPLFTFDMLDRVHRVYRLLGIEDASYRHYWFTTPESPTVDRRDIYPACMSQVPMMLLVMPCRNPDMEFEGMNEVPEEVTR